LTLLAGLVVLLLLVLVLVSLLVSRVAPAAQASAPPLSPTGATPRNDISAYLAGFGYRVDTVGHPTRQDGSAEAGTVVVLMPMQSPSYRLGQSVLEDPETQRQLSVAFAAVARFYPSARHVAVGLVRGDRALVFPALTSEVRAAHEGRLSIEQFWAGVESEATLLDTRTWEPVYDRDFVHKDFSGTSGWKGLLPPNAEAQKALPPGAVGGQIRIQPSSAYLPEGQELVLVATLLTADGQPLPGQSVRFFYTPEGGEPQQIAVLTTGADGAARARFTAPPDLEGTVVMGANHSQSQSQTGAGLSPGALSAQAPLRIGPPVSGPAALGVVTGSLALQGYNVLNAAYDASKGRASVLAEIAAPRFDLRVRGQVLSMAGTLFAVLPAQVAEPVLLYRSGGDSFQLVFRVERADWQAWLAGASDEAQLWRDIRLAAVVDARTGQRIDQRDFISKNFSDAVDTTGITVEKEVESTLAREAWGDQLYPGRFRVPVGAFADSFDVRERTPGTEFAVYSSTDPTAPVYASAQDPDGSRLRSLRLSTGQYLMAVASTGAPARVRLSYVEHLLDSAGSQP
jgi:hypothetical protein